MARYFKYVYERIIDEESAMQKEFEKLPIRGRRTATADLRRIKEIISESGFRVAQACSVIVSYPKMHIADQKVILGEPTIMLPNCRLISIEELKRIERK